LSADEDATASAHIADRLDSLATRFAAAQSQDSAPTENPPTEWSALPLFRIVDTGLRRLEEEAPN